MKFGLKIAKQPITFGACDFSKQNSQFLKLQYFTTNATIIVIAVNMNLMYYIQKIFAPILLCYMFHFYVYIVKAMHTATISF